MEHRKKQVDIGIETVSIDKQLKTIVEFIQDATEILKDYELIQMEKIRKLSAKKEKVEDVEERPESVQMIESVIIFPEDV